MRIDQDLYFISMAARLLGMHPQTLRKYERLGLVQPTRTIGSMRLYSKEELERLKLIKRLVDDGGINLAGVQRLLSIAEVVQRIRPLMREEGLTPRDARRRLSHELDALIRALGLDRTMDFKDYYATLGVAKTATDKELKQAYRKLARKHHPDVNPGDKGAESKFKEINEAYEVLGDPAKRKKYDELGANWRMYEQAGSGAPGGSGSGPQGAWNFDFGGGSGGGGGFRTMSEEEMREMFGDADPFSDFFHTFFGGAGPAASTGRGAGPRGRTGRAPASRPGRDIEHELELPLEDAYSGTLRRFSMTDDGRARTVDVRIPAGVNDGSRVRVPGEGEHGIGGANAGDLYLRIRVAPHSTFERKGRDLYTHVKVPVTTAVLGGEADVPTLSGKPLRLKIPPTTQNAQTFRLKGHGMPVVAKPAERGDLYATVDVELPKQLTPDQRAHYEALQKSEKAS